MIVLSSGGVRAVRWVIPCLWLLGCASDAKSTQKRADGSAYGTGGGSANKPEMSGEKPTFGGTAMTTDPNKGETINQIPPGCGDGKRSDSEACDDGNTVGKDGCSADCLGVEPGYSCNPAGKACRVVARCGDGIVATSEACDDGNMQDGDGCSAHCKLELGFACDAAPSRCMPTVCGDNKTQGSEGCDDGNEIPFDGCSANCQAEPQCKTGTACSSKCGDGLILNEDCDDGNTKDGDGCSSTCKVEKGFMCSATTSCQGPNCALHVPVIYRDFDVSHPDFGVGCGQLVKGVVAEQLNDMGKPVLANGGSACIQSAQTFAEWYTSQPVNATIPGEILLYDNGRGGFVNRYGANGEQWLGPMVFANTVYGGPLGGGCTMCMPSATGQCFDPCVPWNSTNQACCSDASQESFDGNPLFLPIDAAPNALKDMRYRAKIPEQYGYNGWPWEDAVFPGAPSHDFHFTTEVVYWFKYQAKTSARLEFTGDDDVWVFVNGRLAVDLGAPHVPENGAVTIDATSGARFGLTDGNVYEVRVFHAERKVEGSSFKLTLSGFETGRSECTPICGDGIVTLGEECDDGVNDGGYEECDPGCVLGPRCGDNTVQMGEDCDDGNRRDGDGCGSSCRNLTIF